MSVKYRLGCDPEVFLVNRKTGQLQSIIGKIKADKYNPKQLEHLPKGFTLQEDNVALEFGIPPAASAEEFVKNIRTVMKEGLKAVPGEKFSKLSCTIFPKEEMEHPAAHIFGCEPDFNAWTETMNSKPQPPHPYMRSAGGHIHIETKLDKFAVTRAFDLCAVVPSVLMDNSNERRKLYGKAGACRIKPYGVECRSLSNFWIFSPNTIEWAWNAAGKALELVDNGDMPIVEKYFGDDIQNAINNGDKRLAEQLVKDFSLEVV